MIKSSGIFKRIVVFILTAAFVSLAVPVFSLADDAGKAEVSSAQEILDALSDAAVTNIRFMESITTGAGISVSKPVDLNGKTWTVNAGTVLVNAMVENGVFESSGNGEIRYPVTFYVVGAETGEIVNSITAGGKTDTNEPYVKGAGVEIISGNQGRISVCVAADNVAGGIAKARPVTACKTSKGDYVLKGSDGMLFKKYRIKYKIRFVDKDGKEIQAGIDVPNDNVTEYTSYDSVILNDLPVLETKVGNLEFSGWFDSNGATVSGVAIPEGSSGEKVFYGVYVIEGAFPGGRGFNFRAMFPNYMQGEENTEEVTEKGTPSEAQTEAKRISTASSKTTTVFSDKEEGKMDISGLVNVDKNSTKPVPLLIVGIAVMVTALVIGILVISKKR